jgi:predicted Zn-dependent protease with MMP-like domain
MVSFSERERGRRTALRARRKQFYLLVQAALRSLPVDVAAMLDNVEVVVADEPTPEQLADWEDDGSELFGLYEGTPLTDRSGYGLTVPDKITIFQGPLERACETREEIAEEVRVTVLHELAHHFGFDEDRISELGLG